MQRSLANLVSVGISLVFLICAIRVYAADHAGASTVGGAVWAVSATVPGNSQLTLRWMPASGAAGSNCLRYRTSNTEHAWAVVNELPEGLTECTVTGLNNLQSYEFQIGATDAEGNTAWSATLHARPRGLAHPSGLHGGGQINAQDVVLRTSTDGSTFTTFRDGYYEGAAGWPLGLAVEPGFQYTAASSMGTVVSQH